jgi:hypothetical protein
MAPVVMPIMTFSLSSCATAHAITHTTSSAWTRSWLWLTCPLSLDDIPRGRRQHSVQRILVRRQRRSLAPLGLPNDRGVVMNAHRVLDRHPAPVQRAGNAPVQLHGSAEALRVWKDLPGEFVALAGDFEEERLHRGVAHVVGRVAEATPPVAYAIASRLKRPRRHTVRGPSECPGALNA